MFHFQLTQSSQPRIAAVAGTAAGTFIEIFAALGAEPTAVRPAEGFHRQCQGKLLPQKRRKIKTRRTALHAHDAFFQKSGSIFLFRFGFAEPGVLLELVEALVQHHKSFFHAAITRHGHNAPYRTANEATVLLRKKEHFRRNGLNHAA